MSDTPTLPPSGSSAVGSGNTPSTARGQISGSSSSGLINLGVQSAPQNISQPSTPITLEGTVIYSNPNTEEVRIRTEQGEIVVKTSKNLPHGTDVLVKLHKFKQETLANITILNQQSEALEEALNIKEDLPPPTIVKEGDSLKAILLSTAPNAEVAEISQILNTLPTDELAKLNLPLERTIIEQLLAKTNVEQLLSTLAPKTLKELLSILVSHVNAKSTRPDQQQKLQTAYKPGQTTTYAPPSSVSDDDILQALSLGKSGTKPSGTLPSSSSNAMLNLQEAAATNTTHAQDKHFRIDVIKVLPAYMDSKQLKAAIALTQHEYLKGQSYLHTAEYDALPLKAATIDSHSGGSFPVLKTIGNESEQFIIKQSVIVEEDSILLFKAVPTKELSLQAQEQAHAIASALHENISDKDLIERPRWPALEETVRVLGDTAPHIAQSIQNALPTPSQNMVPTTLFLLAALRFGSIEGWLGNNTLKALRDSGRRELAEILSNDFSRLSSLSKEGVADEWKPFSFPMLHDEQLDQVQMFVRDEQDPERATGEGKSKRFIVNLNLSRMGKMQLDGMIYKKQQLDIIVRTEEKLPPNIRQEIMKRFASGVEHVNMQGSVSFQSKQQEWVHIPLPTDSVLI